MKKILVPTDCSDLSGYALSLAQKLARQSGAEIYALQVVPTAADAVFSKEGELLESEDFDLEAVKKEQERSRTTMAGWVARHHAEVVPIVKAGNLPDQILHCVKQENIDLVVMGTHGLSGLRELIADSVTEQVVRKSSVPVLSLKCDRSELEIKDIMLASSFNEDAPKQIGFIKTLQQAFGATIHLLRVNTPRDFKTSRELKERMERFAKVNDLAKVETHIYCDKDVEQGILHFAQDTGIDMISIGVEKDSMAKLFQKHVSSSLVNHLYYPVLTFKI